jgi:hypothetical protein
LIAPGVDVVPANQAFGGLKKQMSKTAVEDFERSGAKFLNRLFYL